MVLSRLSESQLAILFGDNLTRFTIILPTIGRSSLKESVHSVLQQEYRDWRLYIIGDGVSIDSIWHYHELDDRISCFTFEERHNDSGTHARNYGLEIAETDWIAHLDDDDTWHANHLKLVFDTLQINTDASMVRTFGRAFRWKHRSPRSSRLTRRLEQINETDIMTPGMVYKRDLAKLAGNWSNDHNRHDSILWFNMIKVGGKPIVIPHETFLYDRSN